MSFLSCRRCIREDPHGGWRGYHAAGHRHLGGWETGMAQQAGFRGRGAEASTRFLSPPRTLQSRDRAGPILGTSPNPQLLSSLSNQSQENLMTLTPFSHSIHPLLTTIQGCASPPANLPLTSTLIPFRPPTLYRKRNTRFSLRLNPLFLCLSSWLCAIDLPTLSFSFLT